MQHNSRTTATVEASRQICGRVKSAIGVAVAVLRGRLGLGLSRSGLG